MLGEIIETVARGTNTLGMIENALLDVKLEREQIGCLAVGLGPGSYTGIRTAIALAQGWQLARDVKLLGVSSAECIAAQARAENFVGTASVVIDAQRNEFYVARYEINPGACREIEPLRLASLADIQARERAEEALIGPEVARWFPSGKIIFPRAATLGRLAMGRTDFMPGEKLEPIYLRETAFVKAPAPRIISS
jgi:tRNA threonylcarbamoyl adenosine modification protein YeaZ